MEPKNYADHTHCFLGEPPAHLDHKNHLKCCLCGKAAPTTPEEKCPKCGRTSTIVRLVERCPFCAPAQPVGEMVKDLLGQIYDIADTIYVDNLNNLKSDTSSDAARIIALMNSINEHVKFLSNPTTP